MTATSALAAPRGPSVLGRAPRLEERGEAAAPAQLGGSLGIASSSRPARVFQPRSRQPFLCAVLSGERSPAAGAGGRLDLQLHQPLGCKRQHLAHEIGVRVLLHEPEKGHPLAGLVVSPVGSRSGNPNPCRRPAMAAPGQRHQPPTPPRRALPTIARNASRSASFTRGRAPGTFVFETLVVRRNAPPGLSGHERLAGPMGDAQLAERLV